MLISEYIVKYLEEMGITHIFGVGGANIEDIYDAAFHHGKNINAILAKFEGSAAFMADGYSRTTNKLGVVMSTSGGGAVNLVPGLAESFASHTPVLAIIGQAPSPLEGKGAFQDTSGYANSLDGDQLFGAVASNYYHRIHDAENFQQYFYEAVSAALSEPHGTSILLISKDVQLQEVDPDNDYHFKMPDIQSKELDEEAEREIESLVETICQIDPDKPILVLLGDEVNRSNAKGSVKHLIDLIGANVAVTPKAKAIIDNNDSRFVGVSGIASHTSVQELMGESALVIAIGTRMALLTRVDIEKEITQHKRYYINCLEPYIDAVPNDNCHIIKANIRKAIERINERLIENQQANSGQVWHQSSSKPVTTLEPKSFLEDQLSSFNFQSVLEQFNQYIEDDAIIYIDAGNTGAAALHYLNAPVNGEYEIALGMGGMGYTFGASIGAAFASGRRVYTFAGDGAFYMHGLEIHTAVEYNLPIVFVIFNNNAHAMCYTREKLFYQGLYTYNVFKQANLGQGLQLMFPSLFAADISSVEELSDVLKTLNSHQGPACLSLNLDVEELPPFLPFLSIYEAKKDGS